MYDAISEAVLSHVDGVASQMAQILPWVKDLNAAERAELLSDLTQAWAQVRQTGQIQALTEVLEDWEATAEALTDPWFMQVWQQPYDPNDDITWVQVRGEIDLACEPEGGGP
jgi:hypothetical protein